MMILKPCSRCGSESIAWSSDTLGDIVKLRVWCTKCELSETWGWFRSSEPKISVEDKVAKLWNGGI